MIGVNRIRRRASSAPPRRAPGAQRPTAPESNPADTGAVRAAGWTPEQWEIDGENSTLGFRLRHIVVHQISGEFRRWGGTVWVDRRQPWLSKVDLWVDLASVTTGDAERDAHIVSPEFLDVARFPRAEFQSQNVWLDDKAIVVEGRLQLHGLTRDVQVRADVGEVYAADDGRERGRFKGRGTVDRQAFGLHWNQDLDVGGVVVADKVDVFADVVAVRVDRDATNPEDD
jgi:polyisoprenoid-binding protein YceI